MKPNFDFVPLERLFGCLPELDTLNVIGCELCRDGPLVRVIADLKSFPERPPSKWKGTNTVQCAFEFYGIGDLCIRGWETENRMTMKMLGGEILLESDSVSISFIFQYGKIGKISFYLDEEIDGDTPQK